MERDAVEEKESRVILRQVQEHLVFMHTNLGAVRDRIDFVEVFHHPTNPLPELNYVTPRQKTAWVSNGEIKKGLNHLATFGRAPRVQYIEGLFPPLFAKTLRDLKLQVERETPIMAYKPDGMTGHQPPPPAHSAPPDGVSIVQVNDQRGIEMWWYVWRNAFYDVLTLGVEPLFVGRDMAAVALGQQLDFLAYRHGDPIGVARLSIQGETAHLSALALMKEARTLAMTHAVQTAVLKAAIEHHAKLIFAPGETEADRRLLRELGFLDFGSIVCYSAPGETAREDTHVNPLEQPVLSF